MSIAVESYASAWRPQDKRTRCEWATENVKVPNMARGSRFDVLATPWAEEPINVCAEVTTREGIILWPTGAGKSNFVDVFASHSVAEVEGDILLAVQGDREAQKYIEKRLMPCLLKIPKVKEMFDRMPRHSSKRGSIGFPDKTIYWGGANETNAQATSVRAVLVDEAWMAGHGLLEQFGARLHNRWNRIFVALGQGGTTSFLLDDQEVYTEWHSAWLRTDQREWCYQCPQCGEVQRYRLKCLDYERQADDLGQLDENAVTQSARYSCIGTKHEKPTCDAIFPDEVNVRRMLSRTARYVVQHKAHRKGHLGWHLNALGVWYETWGELAVKHALAHIARKRGDPEPFKLFRQKRMAENNREEDDAPTTTLKLGGYKLADYLDGKKWEGEHVRIATIDRQRDHFWLVIRAWKMDGSSRRLYVGKINTIGSLLEKLKDMAVEPRNTFEDCNYERDEVYNDAGRYGWYALGGSEDRSFPFPMQRGVHKFYSPKREVRGDSGKTGFMFRFSETSIKRILDKLMGGFREPFEFEDDITPLLIRHLHSEVEKDIIHKVTRKLTRRFVKRHNDNHTRDCEAMQVAAAIVYGMLADRPEPKETTPQEQTPAPVSTN